MTDDNDGGQRDAWEGSAPASGSEGLPHSLRHPHRALFPRRVTGKCQRPVNPGTDPPSTANSPRTAHSPATASRPRTANRATGRPPRARLLSRGVTGTRRVHLLGPTGWPSPLCAAR